MTFEQCHARITTIRIQQATRHPLIRVECGGVVYFGRLVRCRLRPHRPPEFRLPLRNARPRSRWAWTGPPRRSSRSRTSLMARFRRWKTPSGSPANPTRATSAG